VPVWPYAMIDALYPDKLPETAQPGHTEMKSERTREHLEHTSTHTYTQTYTHHTHSHTHLESTASLAVLL
jgi:hypothetical protein